MSLKMKMIPINCCDSRRSLYQNIYSLFYFRLSRLFSATQASVFFFSCYFPYMYNLEKQDKWGSFLSFLFIYPKLFSVLLYLIYGQHLLSFSAKPSFRFYHNSCSSIFISYYHRKCVLHPTKDIWFFNDWTIHNHSHEILLSWI